MESTGPVPPAEGPQNDVPEQSYEADFEALVPLDSPTGTTEETGAEPDNSFDPSLSEWEPTSPTGTQRAAADSTAQSSMALATTIGGAAMDAEYEASEYSDDDRSLTEWEVMSAISEAPAEDMGDANETDADSGVSQVMLLVFNMESDDSPAALEATLGGIAELMKTDFRARRDFLAQDGLNTVRVAFAREDCTPGARRSAAAIAGIAFEELLQGHCCQGEAGDGQPRSTAQNRELYKELVADVVRSLRHVGADADGLVTHAQALTAAAHISWLRPAVARADGLPSALLSHLLSPATTLAVLQCMARVMRAAARGHTDGLGLDCATLGPLIAQALQAHRQQPEVAVVAMEVAVQSLAFCAAYPESQAPDTTERLLCELEPALLATVHALDGCAAIFSRPAPRRLVMHVLEAEGGPLASRVVPVLQGAPDSLEPSMSLGWALCNILPHDSVQEAFVVDGQTALWVDCLQQADALPAVRTLCLRVLAHVAHCMPGITPALVAYAAEGLAQGLTELAQPLFLGLRTFVRAGVSNRQAFEKAECRGPLVNCLRAACDRGPALVELVALGSEVVAALIADDCIARCTYNEAGLLPDLCGVVLRHFKAFDGPSMAKVLHCLRLLRDDTVPADVQRCNQVAEKVLAEAPVSWWASPLARHTTRQRPGTRLLQTCLQMLKPLPCLKVPKATAPPPDSRALKRNAAQSRVQAGRLKALLCALSHRTHHQGPALGAQRTAQALQAQRSQFLGRPIQSSPRDPPLAPQPSQFDWNLQAEVQGQLNFAVQWHAVLEASIHYELCTDPADARPLGAVVDPAQADPTAAPLPTLESEEQLLEHVTGLRTAVEALLSDVAPDWDSPPEAEGQDETEAATKIQALFRGNRDRGEAAAKRQQQRAEEDQAATKIQARFRGNKARAQPAETGAATEGPSVPGAEAEEAQAATKIQARFRGHKVRQEVAQLQARPSSPGPERSFAEEVAAGGLASDPEAAETREHMDDAEGLEQAQAATKIQARYRGNRHRTEAAKLQQQRAEEDRAATKIQAQFRGNKARAQLAETRAATEGPAVPGAEKDQVAAESGDQADPKPTLKLPARPLSGLDLQQRAIEFRWAGLYAERRWQAMHQEKGPAFEGEGGIFEAFSGLYGALASLFRATGQASELGALLEAAEAAAEEESSGAERVLKRPFFLTPTGPAVSPSAPSSLLVDWIRRLNGVSGQLRALGHHKATGVGSADPRAALLPLLCTDLQVLRRELQEEERGRRDWESAQGGERDTVAEQVLALVVAGTAQQIIAQGMDSRCPVLHRPAAVAVLADCLRVYAGNAVVLGRSCQALGNLARLRGAMELPRPSPFFPLLQVLGTGPPHGGTATYALAALQQYVQQPTFEAFARERAAPQLVAYMQCPGAPRLLRHAAAQLLCLDELSEADRVQFAEVGGVHAFLSLLPEAPTQLQRRLLEVLVGVAAIEGCLSSFLDSSTLQTLLALGKHPQHTAHTRGRCFRIIAALCASPSPAIAGEARDTVALHDGLRAAVEAASTNNGPELAASACAIVRYAAAEPTYRPQLHQLEATAAVVQAMRTFPGFGLVQAQALAALNRLLQGAGDGVLRQFVKGLRGVQTLSDAMRAVPRDHVVQAEGCAIFHHLAGLTHQRHGTQANLHWGRLRLALRRMPKRRAQPGAEPEPGSESLSPEPSSEAQMGERLDVRRELLAEGCVTALLPAMRQFPEDHLLQQTCLHTLRFLADFGPEAQEQLTHPQKRNMATVYLTSTLDAFRHDPDVLLAAVQALLAMGSYNPACQKDICCTPGCLRALCQAVLQLYGQQLPLYHEAPPPHPLRAQVLEEGEGMSPCPSPLPLSPTSGPSKEAEEAGSPLAPWDKATTHRIPTPQQLPQSPGTQSDSSGGGVPSPVDTQADRPALADIALKESLGPLPAAGQLRRAAMKVKLLQRRHPARQEDALADPFEGLTDDEKESALEERLPLARLCCQVLGMLASGKGDPQKLSGAPVETAFFLMDTYPGDVPLVSGALQLLAWAGAVPSSRALLQLPDHLRLVTGLLRHHQESPMILARGVTTLAVATEGGVEDLTAVLAAGYVPAVAETAARPGTSANLRVRCCKALAHVAVLGEDVCCEIVDTFGVEILLSLINCEQKRGEPPTMWACYLLGAVCGHEAVRRKFLDAEGPAIVLRALQQLQDRQAGSEWRQVVMAVDTEEHPYKTPKPTLCRQLIGLALAALLEPDGALHPDMDTELVVGAIQSTKVCNLLSSTQHAMCEQALGILQEYGTVQDHVFLMQPPQANMKPHQYLTTKKVKKLDRLNKLNRTVEDIRRQDQEALADFLAKRKELEGRRGPKQTSADRMAAAEPPQYREHSLTPRVFWHCQSPPVYRKVAPLPENPRKVKITQVTAHSAHVLWERPQSEGKLLYVLRLSTDQGRSFKPVTEPLASRAFRLTMLQPNTVYYLTVLSKPLDDDGEIPSKRLGKRPQTLVRFRTAPKTPIPDRWCATPEPFSNRLPPLILNAVAPQTYPARPQSLPELHAHRSFH